MKYLILFAILLTSCSQPVAIDCINDAGDINYDGEVTPADAAVALDASLGMVNLNDCQARAADFDMDGDIDSTDASLIFQHYLDN